MTISYTTPIEPTFTSVDIPTPITIDRPTLPSSDIDITELAANSVNARLLAWTYERYGNATQAVIDGEIENLLDWTGDEDTVNYKFSILKERILYQSQDKCREILNQFAAAGWEILPGRGKRLIYDIEMDAKKQLSEEAFKLLEEQIKVSQEHIQFALKMGADKETALFDHHHKVQMLNLEAVREISKNTYEVYLKNAEGFNVKIKEFELLLLNFNADRETQLMEREAFITRLQSLATAEARNVMDAELFEVGIKLVDAENRVKLSTIKLAQIQAQISKTQVLTYHAELEWYLANIEVISAQYRIYRTDIKGTIATKDTYLKRLENQRMQIKVCQQSIEEDRTRAKLDEATARVDLDGFRNDVKEFSALLDQKKLEYELTESEYENTLLQWATGIKDSLQTALDEYEGALSTMSETVKEDIGMAGNEVDYNVNEYVSRLRMYKTLGDTSFSAATREESARVEATMSKITVPLTLNIEEGE